MYCPAGLRNGRFSCYDPTTSKRTHYTSADSETPEIARGAKPLSDKEIDIALVERVQRGDKSAYDLLVLKYQHKIGHLVSRYVHDVHEAQDVTQEAFIKAYRGLKNFRGDSAFYTRGCTASLSTRQKTTL